MLWKKMKNNSTISINGQILPVKVAITPEEQHQGLMWVKYPPPIMVFPYNKQAINKFWMKNTISPLDILFCREGQIISICKGEPLSTKLIGPNEPSDLVVELPGGLARQLSLKPGDYVGFSI
jgi:uncharacterized protein